MGAAGEEEIPEVDPAMLVEMLRTVPDYRGRKGRKYALSFILAVCVVAALAGAMNYREMATVDASIPQPALCVLGAEWSYFSRRHEYPRRSTIRAVLAVVDAGELDRITTEWLLSQARRNQEDHNQTFKGNGPQALASLHNLAIGLLRLKNVKAIRETMQEIHLDRGLASIIQGSGESGY